MTEETEKLQQTETEYQAGKKRMFLIEVAMVVLFSTGALFVLIHFG